MTNNFKSGFVSFIGRSNVGKSTLLNTILQEKKAIVSNKPQTTRNQIQGIYNSDDMQIIFFDTPGIHKHNNQLGRMMNRDANRATKETNIICLLAPCNEYIGNSDKHIIKLLSERVNTTILLLLTRITSYNVCYTKLLRFICGDNDTINKQQLKILNDQSKIHNFEIITFNKEKDFIDSELAIVTAISKKINFQQIVIVSDGIRWDMLLASINILKKYECFNPILLGENNYCFLLKAKSEYIFYNWQLTYKYISFFSLDNEEVIYNFSGCKFYPNQDITVTNNSTQTISNEFNKEERPKLIIKKGIV